MQRANQLITQRGDAFTRICEAASRSQEIDTETRKAALGHAINLSTELGTERSAGILTELLFDPSPEVYDIFTYRAVVMGEC